MEQGPIPTDEEQRDGVAREGRDPPASGLDVLKMNKLEVFDSQQEGRWLKMSDFDECAI